MSQPKDKKENTFTNKIAPQEECPQRSFVARFFQVLYCLYALLVFITTMFLALAGVLVCSVFGKVRGGNMIYVVLHYWAIIWYFFIGIRHKEIYEAPHDRQKTYIFVANHISYIDITSTVRCIHQPMRILGKYEMVKYPVFGIIYRMAAIVVDRSSMERRAQSVRALKAALQRHLSIFIFPEGTFNETGQPLKEFYNGAFRIAIETGTTIKPILYVDSHERMHYRGFFELTPGKCRCVYLTEIPVSGFTIKQVPQLRQQVYDAMEQGLKRYRKYNDTPVAAITQE